MTEAYPLQWPDGWPRAKSRRGSSHFSVTPEKAMLSLLENLRRLRVTGIVISSNCKLRRDGVPYAEDLRDFQMRDPGVAVYFQYLGKAMVMAQDAYTAPYANARSLALAIEAMRSIERHGGGHMMQRSFDGFAQLPPPGGGTEFYKTPWRLVLELPVEPYGALPKDHQLLLAEGAYKTRARKAHPDSPGGDAAKMAELNVAIEDARQELQA